MSSSRPDVGNAALGELEIAVQAALAFPGSLLHRQADLDLGEVSFSPLDRSAWRLDAFVTRVLGVDLDRFEVDRGHQRQKKFTARRAVQGYVRADGEMNPIRPVRLNSINVNDVTTVQHGTVTGLFNFPR